MKQTKLGSCNKLEFEAGEPEEKNGTTRVRVTATSKTDNYGHLTLTSLYLSHNIIMGLFSIICKHMVCSGEKEVWADLAHEIWSMWMIHMIRKKCVENSDGSLTIKPEDAKRWQLQMNTPYDRLSEKEKDEDRLIATFIMKKMEMT